MRNDRLAESVVFVCQDGSAIEKLQRGHAQERTATVVSRNDSFAERRLMQPLFDSTKRRA